MPYRRKLEVFARRRRAREYKDSRTDDRADAKRCQRNRPQRLLQACLGVLRIGDQLVDGFLGEQLAGNFRGSLTRGHQLGRACCRDKADG